MSAKSVADVPAAHSVGTGRGEPGYQVVDARLPEDEKAIRILWGTGLAEGPMQEARLNWYYRNHPEGVPRVFLLRTGDPSRTVGAATLSRRRMRFGSESLVAGFLADFVVEPRHRSFFPGLTLQRAVLRHAREAHALVFGTPNPRSEPVLRRAGYRRLGQVVRMARVLRAREYLSRTLPKGLSALLGSLVDQALLARDSLRRAGRDGYEWEWRDRPGPEFDALWERAATSGTLMGVRDNAFLTWRFVESPYGPHRFFAMRSRADRRLVAYAACRVREGAMHVSDFLVDPGAEHAGMRLWLDLSREAYRGGHRSLSVVFLGSEAVRREMEAVGMVARESLPLYAAFDDRGGFSSSAIWYLTNADADGG